MYAIIAMTMMSFVVAALWQKVDELSSCWGSLYWCNSCCWLNPHIVLPPYVHRTGVWLSNAHVL